MPMPPAPTYKHKLDWLDATCVVMATLPQVPEVRGKHYRHNKNPLAGCCLVASQCIYYLTDEPNKSDLSLHYFRWGQQPHQTHYFLRVLTEKSKTKGTTGAVIDPTASQFNADTLAVCYASSVRRAIPETPPARAQKVLDLIPRSHFFRDER